MGVPRSEEQSECLKAALAYLERGWCPIPLCPFNHANVGDPHKKTCKSPGKTPIVNWKDLQHRLPTPKEVAAWWKRNPAANVGVVMGVVSGLVGLDVDGLDAEQLLQEISCGDLPATLQFKTPGGGRRLIYKIPQGVLVPKRRHDRHDSHVLILGEGSYTVMPPSIHHSGGVYE